MKRIIGVLLGFLITFSVFAKDVQPTVTKTDYGFEIANGDAKSKFKLNEFNEDDLQRGGNTIVVFHSSDNTFYADALVDLLLSAFPNKKPDDNNYYGLRYLYLDQKGFSSLQTLNGINYDRIEIVPVHRMINDIDVNLKGKSMIITSQSITELESNFHKLLLNKYAVNEKRKQFEELLASKDIYKNESFAYLMNNSGNLTIVAYLGNTTDSLEIPKEIDGIPVNVIYSVQSLTDSKFKTVSIPKTITLICEDAFSNLGIEKINFEEGTEISSIESNAFRYNQISEINLPHRTISFGLDVFSNNKIKEITVFKEWTFKFMSNVINGAVIDSDYCSIIQSDELEEVSFEEGCTVIPPKAFSGCKNLKRLSIPSTMRKFGNYAFKNCESLSKISFGGTIIADVADTNELFSKAFNAGANDDEKALGDIFSTLRSENAYTAAGLFLNCPIDLKTKRILLQMGLPSNAF